ncbi:MAG: hypothetical protein WBD16_04240 [Pyrinomonadaceae bacterium]
MLEEEIRRRVEKATVKFTKLGGQGVLVLGGLILTAAHCIDYTVTGRMALGESYIEPLETIFGDVHASPMMVETVADIAVLEGLDNGVFCDQAKKFEQFCEAIEPIPIFTGEFEVADYGLVGDDTLPIYKTFDVYAYSHENRWVQGHATPTYSCCPISTIGVVWNEQIAGGTSGSAVVNADGYVLAVISQAVEKPRSEVTIQTFPDDRLFLIKSCLPMRVLSQITAERTSIE